MKKEFIQYIAKTHVSKKDIRDSALYNKRSCAYEHTLYMKEMSFDEVVSAQEYGLSIARVYEETSFLALDIDRSSISYEVLKKLYKDRSDIRTVIGTSNRNDKFHIYVDLGDEVLNERNYRDAAYERYRQIKSDVEKYLGHPVLMDLDSASTHYWHCFFGVCQETIEPRILEDSIRLAKWKCKDEIVPLRLDENMDLRRMSLCSAEYCFMNELLTVHETERFDIHLPYRLGTNRFRISEGHRYSMCWVYICQLIMRARHLKEEFDEIWTLEDLKSSLYYIASTNFESAGEFLRSKDFKARLRGLEAEWNKTKNLPYEAVKSIYREYFKVKPSRDYRVRDYCRIMFADISVKHRSADGRSLSFDSRANLTEECKSRGISEKFFRKRARETHTELMFQTDLRRERKSKIDFSKYHTDEHGRILIPRGEITSYIRKLASINHIKLKSVL